MAGDKRVLAHVLFLEVNGVGRFIPHGAVVPEGVDPEDVERLEGMGHIGVLPTEDGVPVTVEVPEGEPSTAWTVAQIDAWLVAHPEVPSTGRTKAGKLAEIDAYRADEAERAASTTEDGVVVPDTAE